MASVKQFSTSDISKILQNNADPKFGRRNSALVMGAVYWGLTPLELSLISVEDVIAPNGEFFRVWVLPVHASYTNEAREIQTSSHVLDFFKNYVLYRKKNNLMISNLNAHDGLDPKSKFFLNDNGQEYKLTRSIRKNGRITYQARSMIDHLKRMIARTDIQGAKASTFRDSYIKFLWEQGCSWNELKMATGIKNKKTLENKVKPEIKALEMVYKNICRGIKVPSINDKI